MFEQAEWIDGRVTAGHQSTRAKDNEQLPEDHPAAQQLGDMILTALGQNALFISAALPAKVFPPLFNRYREANLSAPMSTTPSGRSRARRIVFAPICLPRCFFSNPDEYEGGELVVEDTYGLHSVKLPAGHMILYPSTSLHHVKPVTRGARVASFFWIQSMVRDDGERTLLFDLDTAIQRLNPNQPANGAAVPLTGVYHNLLRRWAEV